jgi:hypothetical protein
VGKGTVDWREDNRVSKVYMVHHVRLMSLSLIVRMVKDSSGIGNGIRRKCSFAYAEMHYLAISIPPPGLEADLMGSGRLPR